MKKLSVLAAFLIIALLGSYYGVGYLTKRQINDQIELLNQFNGIHADLTEYDRGFFSSQAKLELSLTIPERISYQDGKAVALPEQRFDIPMRLSIYHGPIILAHGPTFGLAFAETTLQLPPNYQTLFDETFTERSTKPAATVSLLVNYLSHSVLQFDLPAFKLFPKQGGEFDWNGLTSQMSTSRHMSHVKGRFLFNGMHFKQDKADIDVGAITSEYTLHQRPNYHLMVGDAGVSLASFSITENAQRLVGFENIEFSTSSNTHHGLFSVVLRSSVKQLITHLISYGPANIELAIRNLDANTLAKINDQANTMQGSDSAREQAIAAVISEIPTLLGRGAELELSKMTVTVPEGTIEGSLRLSLPKTPVTNPLQLLWKASGHGKIRVPVSLLKKVVTFAVERNLKAQPNVQQLLLQQIQQQTPNTSTPNTNEGNHDSVKVTDADIERQAEVQTEQYLGALVSAGFLTTQGSDYVVEVDLNKGNLLINGKPHNLKF